MSVEPAPAASQFIADHDFLVGGGEMGALMRAKDWSQTPLGPVETWSQALRSAVGICLNARFPIAIYWGPELALLYNDAWSPIPGVKHPWALGRPAREVWPEIWDTIGPMFDRVAATGEGTYSEDQLLPMHRRGFTEECYFNFTFSPIRGEGAQVAGIFNAVVETTYRVLDERRTRALRELAEQASAARSAEEACVLSAEAMGTAPADVPFCLLYLLDGDRRRARLIAVHGIAANGPALVELDAADAAWPFATVVRNGRAELVEDAAARLGSSLAPDPWPEAVRRALVAPLAAAIRPGELPAGFLVAGLNPRLAPDAAYRAFIERAASHIAGAVANARAYEEERRRAEALAELDRTKTAFFANVSHEFRTPLTLLLGPLEDMLADTDAPLPPAGRERVEVAHRNALRLLRLVNALLNFSRVEAGRTRVSFAPLDLAALTADLASTFRSLCERAGLALDVDCPPLPQPVLADRGMWETIVLNLLSNAFKFTHEGGIRVSIRPATDGSTVELVVQDTGIGIPAGELPRLFERFHRVEGAQGRSHEGTGIGLALVEELVRLHGGRIAAESELGRGTTFTVRVPFSQPNEAMAHPDAAPRLAPSCAQAFVEEALRWLPKDGDGEQRGEAAADPASSPSPAASRPRILLADDNADMRGYLRRLLAERYTVETVSNGQAALRAALASPPDLVLSDVMMPELDGLALAGALRADPRTALVPIILLSARAGEEAQVEGLSTGADDYLTKPFAAREMLARVRSVLELGRARQQAAERERRLRAEAEAMSTRFETLIEHLPVGAALSDTEGRVLVSNASWRRRNPGPLLPSADPSQERWFGPLPDGRPVEAADFPGTRALRGEIVRAQALRYRGDDGVERWTEVSAIPVRDADGAVAGAVILILDTDESRRAEIALRESEERFRVAADSAPVLIWTTDAEARVTFANKWHEAMFGLSPSEFIGTDGGHRVMHPEDVDSFFADFLDAFARRAPFRREVRIFDREGTLRWLRCDGAPRFDGAGAFLGYTGVNADITDIKQAEVRQRMLIAELNHRVKNTLATVQSLAQQSLRSAEVPLGFAAAFSDRLLALARAHDLLTREEWEGATLADVAAAALAPWLGDGRTALDGPRIRLAPKQALALSMAFGELATNAVKHGALSVPGGRVSLAWERDGEGTVLLDWVESGGPSVRPPSRHGLGSRLLGRPLAAELGGTVDLSFDPAGVRCAVNFPVRGRAAAA